MTNNEHVIAQGKIRRNFRGNIFPRKLWYMVIGRGEAKPGMEPKGLVCEWLGSIPQLIGLSLACSTN